MPSETFVRFRKIEYSILIQLGKQDYAIGHTHIESFDNQIMQSLIENL